MSSLSPYFPSWKELITLFLLLGIMPGADGQIQRWRTLGLEDGLPQVQVYEIAQDPGGWIWIGTHGGVSRFDGSDFRNFTQRDGLEDNHTSCILPLGPNEVFLGHAYSSSFTYLKRDSTYPVTGIPKGYEGRGNDLLRHDDRIIAASSEGLLFFEHNGDTIRFSTNLDTSNGLENMMVNQLFDPGTGLIWGIHDEGILKIDPSAPKGEMIKEKFSMERSKLPLGFQKDGRRGVYVLERDSIAHYPNASQYPKGERGEGNGLPKGLEPSGFIKKEDEFWVGTSEQGIHRILEDRRISYRQDEGLPNDKITSLLLSDAGNVWFGTDHGLAHSTDLAFQFINKTSGMKDPIAWTIERGDGNDLWVGTEGGLTHIRFKTSEFLEVDSLTHFGKEKGLEMIDALHLDEHGRVWVCNRKDGSELLVLDAKDGEVLHRWPLPGEESYVALEKGHDHQILIGGGPSGILASGVDPSTGAISPPDTFNCEGDQLPKDLWDIFRDRSGRIWIGSNGKGAGYLKDGSYHSLKGDTVTPHPRPISITQDRKGDLWFGTIGSGVIHYDGSAFDSITFEDGLRVNTPFFVQADGKGHIWAGTSNGVDRIGIDDKNVTSFGRGKGLIGMETNQNARERMEDGTFWFGTIKGLVRCDPGRISTDSIPPRLHLQSLTVSPKPKDPQREGMALNYDRNHLRFGFIGVHPDDPGHINYKYRLKGLPDQAWSPMTEKQSVTFNHLPPGAYTFQVKARNSDGFWTPDPLSYSFTIEPPFWRTTWFYSSTGILGVLTVLGILRIRTRSLVKQQKRLEKEVALRTQELEEEKQRIEEINENLEEKKTEAEHQKDLVESKNKEITDSLRYAKRIQKALLKEEKRVTEYLPPHFVLFKPREHVSGDFYWALEKDEFLYVTVADCTGHGVPGAFMSMLGTAFLNEICAPAEPKGPATILKELRRKVVKELAQDDENEDLKDGMDISMIRVNLKSREVVWAGANNPLLRVLPTEKAEAGSEHYSKDEKRGAVEYLPDRKPIGLSEDDPDFHEHRFTPFQGEILYLYSDGYPDQFGGERGKKYKSKNFKQLLLEVAALPIDQQREALLEEFERWRGDQEQIDDVCVLGIAP